MKDKLGKGDNIEDLFRIWRVNPALAAKDLFGVDLDKPQRMMLQYRWKHETHIDVCARGVGKTFTVALDALLRAFLTPGNQVGLISPSFRQSKFIWQEVEKLWQKSDVIRDFTIDHPKTTPEKCYLKFKPVPGHSSSFIDALPLGADGGKIRGARYYDVFADEAAQIEDEVLNIVVRGFMATSANPMDNVQRMQELRRQYENGEIGADQLSFGTANRFTLTSTAYYQYNHLWSRISDIIDKVLQENRRLKRKGKSTDHITLLGGEHNGGQIPHRIISNGKRGICAFNCFDPSEGFMNMQSIMQAREEMSDYQWRMEYALYFPPDSEGFFRRKLLDHARNHNNFGPILKPRPGCIYTMGVDPARSGDNFAIAIFELDPNEKSIRLVRVLAYQKKTFPEMHKVIRDLIKLYDIKYWQMDAGGGGTTIRDLLAHQSLCPPGEKLILEQDFDEHRMLTGDRILGPLIQFSRYEWVKDANHNLKHGLESGRLQIAGNELHGQLYTPEIEEAEVEIEKAIQEWSSIITKPIGERLRWDTPAKNQRKDRYSAILVGYDAASKYILTLGRPQQLAMGFFA